ncbi:TonB-dependent receptor [Larkinella punicea]|uniref:TonB-dependent receptor n=1 Tax=Larkinella punicea TaxID=2315727 RepID=A0A368JD25_9BACT|nr:TonB-dependent receptor [Larkinella punicea]RCR65567.1 hypothetical protein DUE52_31370 [Larkinella punicea]
MRQSADARNPLQQQRAHERTLRLNLQGGWRPANRALRSLDYTLGYSVGRQNGYFQDLITRDIFPISSALSDTTLVAGYGKSEYLNQTRVDGNPKSLYGRLESVWFRQTGNVTHRPIAGTEWNTTVNKGRGRQFDPLTPPRQNYSMGDRPRAFADVPALHQWAWYAEDRMTTNLHGHAWTIQAGVRLDQLSVVQQRRQWQAQLAPRINSRLEVVPGGFLRAGYGWMYKAPTLSYLYPNPTYYDLVNFNYFATDPAERMVVMTTRRIVPDTRSVRSFKARKWEVGFDWASEKSRLN